MVPEQQAASPPSARLGDLVDLEQIRIMIAAHHKVAGVPAGIIDATGGAILAGAGWQDIRVSFHRRNPRSPARRLESDASIKAHLAEGAIPYSYKCVRGLWDIGFPVFDDGAHLFSVSQAAREAVGLLEGAARQRGAAVSVASDMPEAVGDAARVREAFQSLVENAIKHMGSQPDPPGGGRLARRARRAPRAPRAGQRPGHRQPPPREDFQALRETLARHRWRWQHPRARPPGCAPHGGAPP